MNLFRKTSYALLAVILSWSVPVFSRADEPSSWDIPSKPAYRVDKARWENLLKMIAKHGEQITYGHIGGISLSKIEPQDTTKPRQADYVTLFGVFQPGEFHASWASLVSEKWDIVTGGDGQKLWKIDQWLIRLDLNGVPNEASHRVMTQTMERQVLDIKDEPGMGVENPQAAAKWAKLMGLWYEWKKADLRAESGGLKSDSVALATLRDQALSACKSCGIDSGVYSRVLHYNCTSGRYITDEGAQDIARRAAADKIDVDAFLHAYYRTCKFSSAAEVGEGSRAGTLSAEAYGRVLHYNCSSGSYITDDGAKDVARRAAAGSIKVDVFLHVYYRTCKFNSAIEVACR